jgi:flavin prenyltransferase
MEKIILAVTGASGAIYAVEFIKIAKELNIELHCIISNAGQKVSGLELDQDIRVLFPDLKLYEINDFTAPMASGSSRFDAMVVLPCSMGTLAGIANGISMNLIHRSADVILKEKRQLLLAVRETPFNRIHLENMLKADAAGAMICPAMPSFYHKPDSIEEMSRFYAARLFDILGKEVSGLKRWNGC